MHLQDDQRNLVAECDLERCEWHSDNAHMHTKMDYCIIPNISLWLRTCEASRFDSNSNRTSDSN